MKSKSISVNQAPDIESKNRAKWTNANDPAAMLAEFLDSYVPMGRVFASLVDPWQLPGIEERNHMYQISYPWSTHVVVPGYAFHDLVCTSLSPPGVITELLLDLYSKSSAFKTITRNSASRA